MINSVRKFKGALLLFKLFWSEVKYRTMLSRHKEEESSLEWKVNTKSNDKPRKIKCGVRY